MGIRNIIKHPDPLLREKCVTVRNFNSNLHRLLDDMARTMYDAEGIGLAAPQVGIMKRVIVMDCGDELIEVINPEIILQEGEQFGTEACLSIPGMMGDVRRAQKVAVVGMDRHGKKMEIGGEDLFARCIQHEIDHLNGILFIDLAELVYEKKAEESER